MTRHLVIFAKAPRMGRIKRRLAADVGGVRAWSLYRGWLDTLIRGLGRDRRWTTWLAVTPDSSARRSPWPLPRHRRFGQGHGDLGQRMARAIAGRPVGPVVLIGADIPDVRPHHVWAAFRLLETADAVFGPTPDGGYWLVGLNRRRPTDPFRAVRWSSPHALSDSLRRVKRRRTATAATLADIDTGADLAAHAAGGGKKSTVFGFRQAQRVWRIEKG